MQAPLIPSDVQALRRALAWSVLLHVIGCALALTVFKAPDTHETEVIDIEVAPEPPKAEALPAEVARLPEESAPGHDETDPASDTTAASTAPGDPGEGFAIDAGVDAPIDAAIDAPVDAAIDARPDAPVDAPVDARPDAPVDARPDAPLVAEADAGIDAAQVAVADAGVDDAGADSTQVAEADAGVDAAQVAVADAGVDDAASEPTQVAIADAGADAAQIAAAGAVDAGAVAMSPGGGAATDRRDAGARGAVDIAGSSGSGAGSGSGSDVGAGGSGAGPGSIAAYQGPGSGVPGQTNEPAVEGAPTTAGTAANLLTYFPQGHVVTVLIRFDRLRGTEWADQTERLLKPMPDYEFLFGTTNAKITEKLETLVISTPSPRDVAATTLVGRTNLPRAGLRALLGAAAPVNWTTAKGGLLGIRTRVYKRDPRVFLSPFRGWFLLAQPKDLPGLTSPVRGDPDSIEARVKLPAWLAGIRKIETESGDEARGPALVLTLQLGGKRVDLGDNDFGLGIKTFPSPDRVSLAMELVKQGWLVRGNMRFLSEKDAVEFIKAAEAVRDRVGDSTAIQLVIGKPLARVVKNLSFARTGGRVSYATSISIADARAILAATAQQLDAYFGP